MALEYARYSSADLQLLAAAQARGSLRDVLPPHARNNLDDRVLPVDLPLEEWLAEQLDDKGVRQVWLFTTRRVLETIESAQRIKVQLCAGEFDLKHIGRGPLVIVMWAAWESALEKLRDIGVMPHGRLEFGVTHVILDSSDLEAHSGWFYKFNEIGGGREAPYRRITVLRPSAAAAATDDRCMDCGHLWSEPNVAHHDCSVPHNMYSLQLIVSKRVFDRSWRAATYLTAPCLSKWALHAAALRGDPHTEIVKESEWLAARSEKRGRKRRRRRRCSESLPPCKRMKCNFSSFCS